MGIQIVSSPTYTRGYDKGPFDYNVVGALSPISYRFKSLQVSMDSITPQESFALLTLRENIDDYLAQVCTITGKNPRVYLEDSIDGVFNYSGVYEVSQFYVNGGVSQLLLKNIGNNSPTYYGSKSFPANTQSQLVYRYRSVINFEVYDTTLINGVTRSILLSQSRKQLENTGYCTFNISELAKGYIGAIGGVTLCVKAIYEDFFGNKFEVMTSPCVLVQARIPELNYGTYTLFNPETNGQILPTTGYRLLYNNNSVYPLYVNFVTNDKVGISGVVMQLRVKMLQQGNVIDTVIVPIPTVTGLNSIDISQYSSVVRSIINRQPTSVRMSISYFRESGTDFSAEFSDEFNVSHENETGTSQEFDIACSQYNLDDRRDFYFSYQNGIGGISTFLCTTYARSAEPEIVALRNDNTISNSVARSTEHASLTFKFASLQQLRFLIGYDISDTVKNDGIFESRTIYRIDKNNKRSAWIIKSDIYDLPNATLYKDLVLSLYRPLGIETETSFSDTSWILESGQWNMNRLWYNDAVWKTINNINYE